MNSGWVPSIVNQLLTRSAVISEPWSERKWSGTPCCSIHAPSASIRCMPFSPLATRMARHSRVNSSSKVSKRAARNWHRFTAWARTRHVSEANAKQATGRCLARPTGRGVEKAISRREHCRETFLPKEVLRVQSNDKSSLAQASVPGAIDRRNGRDLVYANVAGMVNSISVPDPGLLRIVSLPFASRARSCIPGSP